MKNRLITYNKGEIKYNQITFTQVVEKCYGIEPGEFIPVKDGLSFEFDSETGSTIQAYFYSNGNQLITAIEGDVTRDVISVYEEYAAVLTDISYGI